MAYAVSRDGYTFEEPEDNLETEAVEGLVEMVDLDGNPLGMPMHPTQILALAQNDLRMLAFEDNRTLRYLVSANGMRWVLAEDPIAGVGVAGEEGAWNDQRNDYASMAYWEAVDFSCCGEDVTTRAASTGRVWPGVRARFIGTRIWGNGVILDPRDPGAAETPTLSLQSTETGVRITWAHGTLESAPQVGGPWGTADVGTNPANVSGEGDPSIPTYPPARSSTHFRRFSSGAGLGCRIRPTQG